MSRDKLSNMLYFEEFKERAQQLIREGGRDYVLVSLNLCNFKYINDVYGYETGDRLLAKMADYFRFQNPNAALGCRIHSDRFLILTDGRGLSDEKLYKRFSDRHKSFCREVEREYAVNSIHINAGICRITDKNASFNELIDKAEIARKSIKDSYVETTAFYNEGLRLKEGIERSVIPIFEEALRNDSILIFLQPKFAIDTQQIVGAEALVRLRDRDGKLLSPATFIPVLEKAGMISDLDSTVVRKVYKLISEWIEKGLRPLPVSINLSRLDFLQEEIWESITKEVAGYKVPKQYVEYEVTETVFFGDLEYITGKVSTIRSKGYKVSIDDFGSGYSSLNTVGNLPIDVIKFDRSFVQNSINTEKGIAIMSGLVDIFKRIGLEVICEGVETIEEELAIQACGCNLVQGYLHDKPLPVEEFERKYMYIV